MAGDRQVVGEVLDLFLDQAKAWTAALDASSPGLADLAHTIKGSARGIGAAVLGDAAGRVETEGAAGLPELEAQLARAVAEIAVYRARVA